MTAVVQVDVPRLYAALDQVREQRGLSWRQVAAQLGISPSTFSRMSEGMKPSADAFVALASWLGRPAETFTVGWVDTVAEMQEQIEDLTRDLARAKEGQRDAEQKAARAVEAEKTITIQRDGWERAASAYAQQLSIARQQLVDNSIEPDRRIM